MAGIIIDSTGTTAHSVHSAAAEAQARRSRRARPHASTIISSRYMVTADATEAPGPSNEAPGVSSASAIAGAPRACVRTTAVTEVIVAAGTAHTAAAIPCAVSRRPRRGTASTAVPWCPP